jgi:Flp pilus assembly protein TadG
MVLMKISVIKHTVGPRKSRVREDRSRPLLLSGKSKKSVALTSEKGQSLVEFAMVLPLFLFLLVGVAEFGRAWMTRNIMTGAAREAVRIAAVQGNASSATARANAILSSAGLTGASVVLNDDGVSYGTYAATVTYNFPVTVAGFLPGISGASIPLASSTTMRKEF